MIYRLEHWQGPTPQPRPGAHFIARHCEAARAELVRDGLRYDGATGATYDRSGCVCRYSDPASWTPDDATQEAADYIFALNIKGRAARLANIERTNK